MDKDTNQNFNTQSPELTLQQAHKLISDLNNVRVTLEAFIHNIQGTGPPSPPPHIKSWWGRHCFPEQRKTLYKHVTLVTLILQLINLLVLTLIDAWPRGDHGEQTFLTAGSVTMIILQSMNLVLLILATGRLVKQTYKHTVTTANLVQAYLATALLFAGIYTTTFRMEERSWKFIEEDLVYNPAQVFVLYAKFLFYSISTATLCGSDNVLPIEFYNCLFAGLQMLLSFCYFASILGMAVSADVSRTSNHRIVNDDCNNTFLARATKIETGNQQFCCLNNSNQPTCLFKQGEINKHFYHESIENSAEQVQYPFLGNTNQSEVILDPNGSNRPEPCNSNNVGSYSPDIIPTRTRYLQVPITANYCAPNARSIPFTCSSSRTSPVSVSVQQQPFPRNCCEHSEPGKDFSNNSCGSNSGGLADSRHVFDNSHEQCGGEPASMMCSNGSRRFCPGGGCSSNSQQDHFDTMNCLGHNLKVNH